MKPIAYGRHEILQEDIDAVVNVLRSDFLTQGPIVAEFEKGFAKNVDAKFAVAVNNATAALHLCYKILNRDLKKKVLVTPITFVASSNCVLFEGGEVDFVDIDPLSFNIDIGKLEEKIKLNPNSYQGIIIVDFAGLPVNTEEVKKIAEKFNLWIIEDACHAIGGGYFDLDKQFIKCGSNTYTDLTVFSFHPVKHLATGEGGMITTNNEETYKHLLKLRSHGITKENPDFDEPNHAGWHYEMQELGYNYRMPDINAALGLSQLYRIESNIINRQKIAKQYQRNFEKSGIKFQVFDEKKFSHAYHLFIIEIDRRLELYNFLRTKNIFSQVHYIPVYLQPYYRKLGFEKGLCPNAESYYEHCLSLPIFHSMKDEEFKYISSILKQFDGQK